MFLYSNLKFESIDIYPIRDLVAEISGLYFDERRFYFIEKRIRNRMKQTNSKSVKDYFRLLKLSNYAGEIEELITALTINETYFYRNIPQLESFIEEILPLVIQAKKKGDRTLKFWSAGCSSGEEAYTLSILLQEHLKNPQQWKIEIIGSDIDQKILRKAQRALYNKRQVKNLSSHLIKKYFNHSGSLFQLKDEIKNSVQFSCVNLMNHRELRQFSGMDFVFCRNVLIYFNDDAKKQVVNSIFDILNPGGYIFLGHSESVANTSAMFKLIKFNKSLSYMKPCQ